MYSALAIGVGMFLFVLARRPRD